ncbi:hypothetical protein [Tsukamurella sp. USMM236]|uniref:hypothetical protein n=1 Tax=Tsukamurella sp. USMM236 TaxID=3081301 RepID=UPI00301A871B
MTFTKVRVALVAALCAAVVLCGVGLWMVESRLVSHHPECVGTGSPRVSVTEPVGEQPVLHRALDRVLGGLGCSMGPAGDLSVKSVH